MDRSEIERIAQSGDAKAQLALAERFEQDGTHTLARGLFANAAKNGAEGALRKLAVNLILFPPQQYTDGVQMLRAAAERGDREALYLCAMVSARDALLPDRYNVVLDYLARAAAMGHGPAQTQLLLLAQSRDDASSVADWNALRARIDVDLWTVIPHRKILREKPHIEIFENFIRPEICDWFIETARPRLKRATIYDTATGYSSVTNDVRTNSSAEFVFQDSNAIFTMMQAKIITAAGAQRFTLEDPSVLHYKVGEEFGQHFDFLDPAKPAFAADLAARGQRVMTFLIYLNDDFDGGETDLPLANVRYRGNKGDAILFRNVDGNGNPDWDTQHAGLAPTRGEKWLLSQWVRWLQE
jgi:prolyl 4-hydroxylase